MLTRHRHAPDRADPLYGYGYRPDWPSILSVAHDTTDAARVFVITDRPCVLYGPGLPLTVVGGGGGGFAICDNGSGEIVTE